MANSKRIDKTHTVSVPDTATLAEAMSRLIQAGGDDRWWLYLTRGGADYKAVLVAQFADLLDRYGPALFEAPLVKLPIDTMTMRGAMEFASSALVQLYGEYVNLADEARSAWKPNGKSPPVQTLCGHRAWPELNAKGKWVCSQCKTLIPER
jgi:hypothetical protein